MKILLVALFTTLLTAKHRPAPPPSGPGFCGEQAHYQCHQIGLAMSCTCVPNN